MAVIEYFSHLGSLGKTTFKVPFGSQSFHGFHSVTLYIDELPEAKPRQRKESLEVPEQSLPSKSHYPALKRSKSHKAMSTTVRKKPLKRAASLRMFLGRERLRKSWIEQSRRKSMEASLE